MTKTTPIDPAKAQAGLTVRPADAQTVEMAAKALRNARRILDAAKADAKAANEMACHALRTAGLGSAQFLLQAGIDLKATLATPCTARKFDVTKVPAELLETVTKLAVDSEKWDAAVKLGLVSDEVQAAVVTPGVQFENVVLTEHASQVA